MHSDRASATVKPLLAVSAARLMHGVDTLKQRIFQSAHNPTLSEASAQCTSASRAARVVPAPARCSSRAAPLAFAPLSLLAPLLIASLGFVQIFILIEEAILVEIGVCLWADRSRALPDRWVEFIYKLGGTIEHDMDLLNTITEVLNI